MTSILNNRKTLPPDGEKAPRGYEDYTRQVARQVEAALEAIRPMHGRRTGSTDITSAHTASGAAGLVLPFRVPVEGGPPASSAPVLFPFPSLAQGPAFPGQPYAEVAGPSTRQEEKAPPAAQEHLYEGAVQVRIRANRDARGVVHFVRALCQRPEVRLVRLVSDPLGGSVNLWLTLREPLPLLALLRQMTGVNHAQPLADLAQAQGSCLEVCLGREAERGLAAA